MNTDWFLGAGAIVLLVSLIGGTLALSFYTAKIRQECVVNNAQRTATEVFVLCGKP